MRRLSPIFALCLCTALASSDAAPAQSPARADGNTRRERMGFSTGSYILNEPQADLDADYQTAASAGRWVRSDCMWSDVQSGGPAAWNWTRVDRWVDAATTRGLSVLMVLTFTPGWARVAGATDDHYEPAAANYGAFAEFCRQAVLRYSPRGVRHYEIWNEPNVPQFWKPRPNAPAYVEMLKLAYGAMKQADPSAVIVTGGTAPAGTNAATGSFTPSDWYKELYSLGAKGHFDAVGHHPYAPFNESVMYVPPPNHPEWNAFLVQTPLIYDQMCLNGDSALKIWGTEVGAATGGTPSVSEAAQAVWVNDYCTQWFAWPFADKFLWYAIRDINTSDAGDREMHFGVIHTDRTPKPALQALVTQSQLTDTTASVGAEMLESYR
jgi:polysaccharide biosynthesis protein PslG